jgi:L-alanine-DL-glutamate epimerase-like enolase superfamily enzyme
VPIERIEVSAYTISTDYPEADGTLAWDQTTIVIVQATACGKTSLGYSYADAATARLIQDTLANVVTGLDAMAVPDAWALMVHAIRNLGRPGIASMAIAAVDNSLWDLKARLLDLPLVTLLGAVRAGIPAYGSGGFTSYSLEQLQKQLRGWVAEGMTRVKMKIGTEPRDDLKRVGAARDAIGREAQLMVDANGAYSRKQALWFAEQFTEYGVTWFEEPVVQSDLDGLHLIRDRAPVGMDIASGEYGYDLLYFRRMLDTGAVDVVQADATRCAGITEFMRVASLCEAYQLPLSAHTSPTLHAHPCCALDRAIHVEYFHDHARIEHLLFDGALTPLDGNLRPDLSRPGLGLELKRQDAARWRIQL